MRRTLAWLSIVVVLSSIGAVTWSTARASGANVTSFTIAVDGKSSDAVGLNAGATLSESGLPDAATGTVTYTDSLGDTICAGDLPTTSCDAPADLAVGTYPITAAYSGDGTYSSSDSTNSVSLTVLAPTTTAVTVTPTGVASGAPVSYSAVVTSSYGVPTGTVTFRTPARLLCSAVLSGGSASCSASTAPIGVVNVTAVFAGDGTFSRSTATTTLTVYRATPSLTCARVSGKIESTLKVSRCTPFSASDRVGFAPGSFARSGGTLTWRRSGQTATVTATATSPGQGACQAKFTEEDLSGDVTGGTSQYALVGDPVSIRLCLSAKTGTLHLVAGTTAEL